MGGEWRYCTANPDCNAEMEVWKVSTEVRSMHVTLKRTSMQCSENDTPSASSPAAQHYVHLDPSYLLSRYTCTRWGEEWLCFE